jgi:hypothetical protein
MGFFENNLVLVIFCVAIGMIMLFARFKEFRQMKETIDTALEGKTFEKYDYSKWVRALYVLFVLFGVISIVYGIMNSDFETISMGVVLTLMFIGEILIVGYRYALYYGDSHFIAGGKLCRYKSIKDFEEMKYFKRAFVRAVTFNGDKIPMSRKAYELIKDRCIQRRK